MKTLLGVILAWFSDLKGRLFSTQTGTKPSERDALTKFSIVVILLLDLFIFSLIYQGIEEQGKVVTPPETYASSRCRSLIESFTRPGTSTSHRDTAEFFYAESSFSKNVNGYGYVDFPESTGKDSAPECVKLMGMYRATDSDTALQQLYRTHYEIVQAISTNETQAGKLRTGYDTKLLEKIAGQDPNLAINPGTAATTAPELEKLSKERAELEKKMNANADDILANPKIREIENVATSVGPALLVSYESALFWYPVKVLGVQVLFLIPLLLVVAFWSNRSLMRGRPYQLLMASHLLAILGIFVVLKLIEFVYDIIPHQLIADIIDWLTSIQLVGIWYYALIFASVSMALGIVYFIQRRVKIAAENRKAEIGAKRAEKGDCWSCGSHLPMGARNCIRCGVEQYVECQNCKHSTLKAGEHCMHCGKPV